MQTTARHHGGPATGDEALGSALNRALRRPRMAVDEERRLARRAAAGDLGARDRLVEGHVRLVVAIAREYRGRRVPHADLVQEGMMGLLRAVERFDVRRGNRLATYAAWWIRRAMLHAIAGAPAIRLPPEGSRERAAILRTEGELTSHGRPRPDAGTLSARTGVPVRRVERLRRAPLVVASLDEQVAGSETTRIELMVDQGAPEVASALDRADASRELRAAVSRLGPRMRTVIELRYGLVDRDGLTYEDVGRVVGLSAERVRQIEVDGLRRLRALARRDSLVA
jgi:RNA polymerase sigma factor (sigma-70 family)